jgi:hypothetical protein
VTTIEVDKGRTMVMIYKRDLEERVNSFIKDNHIIELKANNIQKMQTTTQNTIKQGKNIRDPTKRKYIQPR